MPEARVGQAALAEPDAGSGAGERRRRVRRATGPLLAGALGTVLGVALSVLWGGDFAALLTVAGAVMLLWGIHRLGRLGADPPESSSGR